MRDLPLVRVLQLLSGSCSPLWASGTPPAAVRDVNTKAVGSASQYVEVPRVGSGRLALSGVLLQGLVAADAASAAAPEGLDDAVLIEPQVRILEPGTEAVYAYEIYDGLKGAAAQNL
jgi:hypothetical protein